MAKEFVKVLVIGPELNELHCTTGSPTQELEHPAGIDGTPHPLPKLFEEAVRDVSQQSIISATSLPTLLMTYMGTALGNSVVLETSLFSSPLNPCLDCALLDDRPEVELLVQMLAQPLWEEQDRRIGALGNLRPKDIKAKIRSIEEEEEAFFGRALFRDVVAQESFQERKRALEDLICPVLVVENLAPGFLHQAVMRSGGRGLLDLRNSLAVRTLLKARKKAKADFELTTRAFQNKTREAALFEDHRGATPVRPAISCLLHCDSQSLASLLCSTDGAVRQFCAQLMICSSDSSGTPARCGSAAVPDSWRALIANLLLQRAAPESRRLSLSDAATALLRDYMREIGQQRESGRLVRLAPVLVGKKALILKVTTGEETDEVSDAITFTAIELTRRTIRDTNLAANQCVSAEQSSSRVANRARVLRIVRSNCQISERDLQRSANLKIDAVRAIVEELVHMGQVRYAGAGLIEGRDPQAERK